METDYGTERESDVTRSLVSRLIATQFPEWSGLTVVPMEPDGWDNRTFRLGDDKLVRLPSAAAYAAQVEKEQRWLPALAPMLPLPIPSPVAMGEPGEGYSWRWSVYRWLDGEPATVEIIGDREQFARDLATFLRALQRIDAAGGLPPGAHNFYRGGPVATYDCETRRAIASLRNDIERGCCDGCVGGRARVGVARAGRLGARRRERRQPPGDGRRAECGDRLRLQQRRRPRVRPDDRVDVPVRAEQEGLPRDDDPRRRDVGTGARMGAVEGPHHRRLG